MDEPFAGVDAATERAVIQVLRDLDSAGRTVICVHHDLQTVADYFDHVLLLNTRVVAAGPVGSTLNAETLHRTYGGRLGPADVPGVRKYAAEAGAA
jgi:manganese/zinc/iron transport system ATP- binding protein